MVVLTRLGPPEDGIRHVEPNVEAFVNEKRLGKGRLYIAEARVSFVSEENAAVQFSLEYPHVAMHAIQKDPTRFPKDNLYLIIDVRLVDSEPATPETSNASSSEDEDDGIPDDDPGITEVRFAPEAVAHLDAMFKAMSECQTLHPDPDAGQGDEAEDEEEEEDGDQEDQEEGNGQEGMFDDAEEEDGGNGNGTPMET